MADNSRNPKKISELTTDEIGALVRGIGMPGLPYPMARLKKGDKGTMEFDVGVIASAQNPLRVYSEQSNERVYGTLMRQAPIPAMMLMLRDLLTKIEPESKNRIMTVFGDAAFGKSHLFKLVGSMVHPQGCISVDCGGMNMREIFFRTVIDYGQGVKEQFEKRVSEGKISQTSLDALEQAFPGSVITKPSDDGLTDRTFINWDAVGKPRQTAGQDGAKANDEDRGDAAIRARDVLVAIYEKEGISVQTNAFGIKTVPGEWFESMWTGRPLFLDEFNKSKKGTLDAFQTALQFANGEIDDVTIYNPMAQAGDGDSPKSLSINRKDIRMGWFIGVAGNDASDGDTTQELSTSMMTRLNPMYIGEPGLRDWNHRISQIWTGLPLVTLYNLFEKEAKAEPAKFSKMLVDLRKMGLTAEEQIAIPPHELYFLQNFQETVQAVNQVGRYYNDRLQLSDPESKMFDKPEYRNLSDEIAAHGQRVFVSFRKAIADFNKAIQSTPEVRLASEASIAFDLASAFKALDTSAIGKTTPGWHRFGSNMVAAIQESIANDTLGMPMTNAALITLCETNGIFPATLKEAKPGKDVKPLPELLKYDSLKDLGGTEELMEVRGILMACLKAQYPNLKQTDELTIPLENLGRALMDLKEQANRPPESFIVPNDDLNSVNGAPLVMGHALPNYILDDPENSTKYSLVNFRTALTALAVPEYRQENRAHIWPVDLDKYLAEPPTDKSEIEAMKTVKGNSGIGFDLVILAALDDKKEPVYLYVVEDKFRDRMMVVGPEEIPPALRSELAKNGVDYAVKGDEASIQRVNDFLADGAKERGVKGNLPQQGNTQLVIEGLIKAFSSLCELADVEAGDDPNQMTVNKGSTLGLVIHRASSKPSLYTSIVKQKAAR